jgi:hypothetical protein
MSAQALSEPDRLGWWRAYYLAGNRRLSVSVLAEVLSLPPFLSVDVAGARLGATETRGWTWSLVSGLLGVESQVRWGLEVGDTIEARLTPEGWRATLRRPGIAREGAPCETVAEAVELASRAPERVTSLEGLRVLSGERRSVRCAGSFLRPMPAAFLINFSAGRVDYLIGIGALVAMPKRPRAVGRKERKT